VRSLDAVAVNGPRTRSLQNVIRKYVKGLRVRLTHRKGVVTKKITKLVWTSAADYEFQLDDQLCTVKVCAHSVYTGAFRIKMHSRTTSISRISG
jgi:hypothetical protein